MTFRYNIVLSVAASLFANTALIDVRVGFIGSPSSDTGPSTLRGVGVVIEEINAADGMSDEKFVLVSANTGEDVTEGVKVYECLAETEEVDFIISEPIDDVSLSWLLRVQEPQVPTLDTWTSYIGITDMVIEDPETMTPYSVNIASDEALAVFYISLGTDVLEKETGQDNIVILAEDIAFGETIAGPITKVLDPVAGIETKEIITYDIDTVDFAPLFPKTQTSGADFIYQVDSANSQVISSQRVKLQMPMAMIGVNISALGLECWKDAGGAGGGISTPPPIPSVGLEPDPKGQKFVNTYQAKYDGRPKMPHFNEFNTYWSLEQAVAAIEAAGGFGDAKAWSVEMKKQGITLRKDGKMWLRYAFWGDDEVEEVTGRIYPHNARFDLVAPYNDTQPSMVVIQWKGNDEVGVVYPPEYATIEFTVPSWAKQPRACKLDCFNG